MCENNNLNMEWNAVKSYIMLIKATARGIFFLYRDGLVIIKVVHIIL